MIIKAGTLLTVDEDDTVLQNKAILIDGGKIISIIDIEICDRLYPNIPTIDARKQIVMPGFVNTHTHIGMSYLRGIADDLPLESWLNDYIWPCEKRCITQEFVYESSLHGIAEMVKNGITFFNDMYFYPEQTAKACNEIGIRANLGLLIFDLLKDIDHTTESVQKAVDTEKENHLVDYSLAVHSVYTTSRDQWEKAIAIACENHLILHTHLSETAIEVKNCRDQYGKSPIKFVYDLGAFDQPMLFAHGVWLDNNDFTLIENKPCSVSINLHSNLKLASGIAPIKDYIDHGANISIGTDGAASNNTLSIADEISTAGRLYKAFYSDASFLPTRQLVRMATINGAKALGKGDITGSIEVGKSADIICIDVDNFACQPVYDPYSYLIYSMNRQAIQNVVIAGRCVLQNGKLTTIDEGKLLDNAYKNKQKMIAELEALKKENR